jgi:CheY-like chemotaxis protein
MKSQNPILLVEDDEIDAMTVKRALKELQIPNVLYVAENGEVALDILNDEEYAYPCLIFLDLNMPKLNGLELLQILKTHDRFKIIPVVVLTTSNNDQDRQACFHLGVAGYMLKPVDYQQFVNMITTIDAYWTLSELPELD